MKHIPMDEEITDAEPVNPGDHHSCKGCGEELDGDWVFCTDCERIYILGLKYEKHFVPGFLGLDP